MGGQIRTLLPGSGRYFRLLLTKVDRSSSDTRSCRPSACTRNSPASIQRRTVLIDTCSSPATSAGDSRRDRPGFAGVAGRLLEDAPGAADGLHACSPGRLRGGSPSKGRALRVGRAVSVTRPSGFGVLATPLGMIIGCHRCSGLPHGRGRGTMTSHGRKIRVAFHRFRAKCYPDFEQLSSSALAGAPPGALRLRRGVASH